MATQKPTRDPGLTKAIEACNGSITELARRIGVAPNTISSNWWQIPTHRVGATAQATGLAPSVLRPDLYYQSDDDEDF